MLGAGVCQVVRMSWVVVAGRCRILAVQGDHIWNDDAAVQRQKRVTDMGEH